METQIPKQQPHVSSSSTDASSTNALSSCNTQTKELENLTVKEQEQSTEATTEIEEEYATPKQAAHVESPEDTVDTFQDQVVVVPKLEWSPSRPIIGTIVPLASSRSSETKGTTIPLFVCIGPNNRNKPPWTADNNEHYKEIALKNFLERSKKTYDDLRVPLLQRVDEIRSFYTNLEEKWQDEEELITLMIKDGCFILEFLSIPFRIPNGLPDNSLFSYKSYRLLYRNFMTDLLKLDNQLPYCVLSTLWSVGFPGELNDAFLSRMLGLPSRGPSDHFMDFYYRGMDGVFTSNYCERTIHSASELAKHGVRFRVTKGCSSTDFRHGTLLMQRYTIDKQMISILTNLIMHEEKLQLDNGGIKFNLALLDYLVQTIDDVKVLKRQGFISVGTFEDDQLILEAIKAINKSNKVLMDSDRLKSYELIQKMDSYCSNRAKICTRLRSCKCCCCGILWNRIRGSAAAGFRSIGKRARKCCTLRCSASNEQSIPISI